MTIVRWLLGQIILTLDFFTSPKPIVRDKKEQEILDVETAKMSLYQFNACPFCVKVRRQLRKHSINIELRDAKNNTSHKAELIKEGGKHKVPCLRIEDDSLGVIWLYESKQINLYLKEKFKL
tara:strand:- start:735 stop:1100 length:366 start_codon:yes stop_codon:yes gene_type:complete